MRFSYSIALFAASIAPLAVAGPANHGGILFSSGIFDLEFVMGSKGHYTLFFTDPAGEELPASVVSDMALSIDHGAGPKEILSLKIDDSGESWFGSGASGGAPISSARVIYRFRGKTEQADIPFSTAVHAEFRTPPIVKTGESAPLTFAVKDFLGRSAQSLEIVHEKPMHLMVVSRDLAEFDHIHPVPSTGGILHVTHTFLHGGAYRLFADYTPVGGPGRIEAFDLKVQGPTRPPIPLEPTTVWNSVVGDMRMVLTPTKPLRAGEDIGVSMTLSDAHTGAPIHNLKPYLGAWAHLAVISEDTQDFIHIHPMDDPAFPVQNAKLSPSSIRTSIGFRHPGIFKMWVQVQHLDKILTFPFVFRVNPAAGSLPPITQASSGATLIKVSSAGYEPARIQAKAGQPLKLAFFRVDAQNCGRLVKFPSLGIERELPPGQTVVIEVTPRKSGALTFSCGMNMMHGELLVQ
jgi:hypothetical protein